ncbi:MAG: ribonuclease HII [Flavobacteriaceae bacterium]
MKYWGLFILIISFISCAYDDTNSAQLIDFVPEETYAIVSINDYDELNSSLNNNDLYELISKSELHKELTDKLDLFEFFKPTNKILFCFSKDENNQTYYTLITKNEQEISQTDSLANYMEETLTYKNKKIQKHTTNNSYYSTINDSILMISTSLKAIENSNVKKEIDLELQKLYNTTDEEKPLSILLNIKDNNPFNSFFVNDSIKTKQLSNYISVDIDMSQKEILFNGVTKAVDSSESLINIFKNLVPQKNQMASITPLSSDGFLSFTFNDFILFKENLRKFNNLDSIATTTSVFDNIKEIGVIYDDGEKAVILNSIDSGLTKEALLSEQSFESNFRQIDIFNFSDNDLFSSVLYPLITFDKASYYCIIENFFVFSSNVQTLQDIISSHQNKSTFDNSQYYKNIESQLSSQSSLLTVVNGTGLMEILNKNLQENLDINLNDYKASALQFVYDNDFAHINGIINKSSKKGLEYSVSEELNIKLDSDLLIDPQLVTNHYTKEKEIVVQDVNNNLYLISNKGKILWKKRINGQVLGKIEQIDIYKNGRLQLLFATPHRVYLIDRNGNDVAPFPENFNDEITQPLSVFDYDNKKNYRLVVTQGKNVIMYNALAQVVKGFTFKSAKSRIVQQPQHFRIGSKDYIVIKTEDQLYILNRTGKTRIKPKTSNSYSDQLVYLYKHKFTTSSSDGDLISIDLNGNVASQNLNISESHNIDATSKTLVAQYENKLRIKQSVLELDYGSYTKPKIFYLNDKIYITVTDLQAQKVYLFDSQAKLLSNFPVYGNSVITLENIDSDRNLEFVVKGESNSILIYKIN